MSDKTEVFTELVYAEREVFNLIKSEFDSAVFSDASDCVHEERFEVTIQGATEDQFYPFAIKHGFVRCCFRFELMMLDKENEKKIKSWIDISEVSP